jgi:NAD(P)-dependent dehydrogenase (short-subunit alcohol dehydrogenase family)
MKELSGRVAVVTGAASGIGRAMAERFAAEGMKLVLADVEPTALAAAESSLRAAGREVLAVRTDVSKAAEVEALAARAEAAFGKVHVLCNNAGVAAAGMTWEVSLADWEWVLGVNLWGVIHGVRAFVPRMLAHGEDAHVVNTASIAGLVTTPGMSPYSVSKHGVVTLTEALYHELAMVSGGRVSASVLCPGWVATQIADSQRNRPGASGAAAQAPASADAQRAAGQSDGDGTKAAKGASSAARKMDAAVRQLVAAGISPAQVADEVLSAVHERRFYVLTHPAMTPSVKHRMDAILAGAPPAASIPR